MTNKILYGNDFKEKLITNFNNCYEFVGQLCDVYPEIIGNYDQLDVISKNILGAIGKHYRTESLHRAYRLLVENGEIKESMSDRLRKKETEGVMHDIPRWGPGMIADFESGQTKIVDSSDGRQR